MSVLQSLSTLSQRRTYLIRALRGVTPKVAETAWVSEFAYVVGNVEIGEYASIWPGVTVRGDGKDAIVIGDYVNIQEGSVIHGNGLTLEDRVSVGHSVVVHCDRVGRGSLLGNNCTVLNRAILGENCLVAANSVVLAGAQVPRQLVRSGGSRSSETTGVAKAVGVYAAYLGGTRKARWMVQGERALRLTQGRRWTAA